MGDLWRRERVILLEDAARRIDDIRRRVSTTLLVSILELGFGLLPLVPNAPAVFGVVTVRQSMACVAPAFVCTWVALAVHRKRGSGSRFYRFVESLEIFCMYGATLGFCYAGGSPRGAAWGVLPYTAMFCAVSAPSEARRNGALHVLANVAFVAACLATESPDVARMAVGVGAFSCIAFLVVATRALRAVDTEAERNVLWHRLNQSLLEDERSRIALTLDAHIGQRLSAFAAGVRDDESPDLRGELAKVVRPAFGPQSLEQLAETIDVKCRPLCEHYDLRVIGKGAEVIDQEASLALLRVAQELVRNAVTHGEAQRVEIELCLDGHELSLRVRDDGRGLSMQQLENATGGLANACGWLRERHGELRLVPVPRGTELLATTMP